MSDVAKIVQAEETSMIIKSNLLPNVDQKVTKQVSCLADDLLFFSFLQVLQ